ncbi:MULTISPECIES: hypothetical protein [Metallosphaera]|nr:hypothetical protein [Metallosphaera javensis (ex Hofmann et al. 2022)]
MSAYLKVLYASHNNLNWDFNSLNTSGEAYALNLKVYITIKVVSSF